MNVDIRCPSCLTHLPVGARRCAACGTSFLTARERTRRRTLLVATLLVGTAASLLVVAASDGAFEGHSSPRNGARGVDGDRADEDSATSAGRSDDTASHRRSSPDAPPTSGDAAARAGGSSTDRSPLDADDGGAGSLAVPAPPPASMVRHSRDAVGRRLRAIAGHVVAVEARRAWVVPLAALAGAATLEEDDAARALSLDGGDLAFFELAPGGPAAVAVAPWSELPPGAAVWLAEEGAAAPSLAIVERDEREKLLVVACATPLEQRFVVDATGRLVGLLRATVAGRATVVTLAGALERQRAGRTVELATLQESLFAADPAAQRALASWYAAGSHYEAALDRYLVACALDPALREQIVRPATALVELALRAARTRDGVAALLPLLERAARRFDREPRVLHAYGLALLDEGAAQEALPWFSDAARIAGAGDGPFIEALRSAYLHAGEEARAAREPERAIALLEEGLQRFREEPRLLQSLGFAYYEFGDRERARIVLEKVASLDEGQAAALATLLASLAPPPAASGDAEAVEIRFDRAGGAIRTSARFSDKVDAGVIVDTGASLTAISEGLADRLKLDRRRPLRMVTVTTASGRLEAPVVLLTSVDLQGARVTEVEAVVLPLQDDGGGEALVGLNFLEHFDLSLDARRGVLRLAAKR